MACNAGERLALAETAAGHQSHGRKTHRYGIFQLGLIARIRRRNAMAFSANLRLRRRSQTPRIEHLAPNCGWFLLGFRRRNVRAARSVAALALHARLHGAQIRPVRRRAHIGRMAIETMRDGFVILQQAQLDGRWMSECSSHTM